MQKSTPHALLVFGTRPEAIKMAPVIRECQKRSASLSHQICVTGQHLEMLKQVTDYFEIQADINLQVMSPGQSLAELTSRCIAGIDKLVEQNNFTHIVAQGDTTTVLAAAMVSFYRKITFVHIEAGLRTHNLNSPWPEEYNRRVAGISANIHCAATDRARKNLVDEGILPSQIHVTGNTVVDALRQTLDKEQHSHHWKKKYHYLSEKTFILVTAHRRENFGKGIQQICEALRTIAMANPTLHIVFPVHLNPQVRLEVRKHLGEHKNVHLIEPCIYPEMVWLMNECLFIMTDSGGIQEEAPSLKKPVVVMRDTTERQEAVTTGCAILAGTESSSILEAAQLLLSDTNNLNQFTCKENPFGNGHAAEKIVELIVNS
ncbi:UDP-N-acetylglucosamine 2-epimerase (non-hydrolyzing) [bacterium]|nr:UDP-N-acetylglucosamine 2-epimerase (non-hydrolyzing) [bacterium]